ncbi:MAG: succinate dehydrogenase/fumarate reductase iron-sulfur subunit [Candidatus Pseudobacter hemicellulosilyticus]|uniref:Succinate dehydrogenase/fumarate reductase iron-sulfur subunit n=1 Tax=Candidatus Pseudobacter hemicellulosilyticus TaxID=3121375 RepID=A0AAJ6BFR4_9BACT|nr:MAG: succinate dehydrogenase/fumarate reductase iron-sulfur subunit [Pseudobacter sp.]
MNLTLKVWRQKNSRDEGAFETYQVSDISSEMSFLEMFDVLNERLISEGKDPIAFDHDCREGICGMCSMYIDGRPHGPWHANTTCQLHMRAYKDGDTITVEPWRAKSFPVIKDLVVDRTAFDRIIQAGGYISVNTGNAVDANAMPIDKNKADLSFANAACIGCGACVAACKNSSAMLFTSAKVTHLALLPQGDPERKDRVLNMIAQMDKEGFGGCTNTGACEAVCPKEISISNIANLNAEYLRAGLTVDK